MIAGSMSGIAVFSLFDAGLVAGPSPIFSYLALTPRDNFLGIILGVLVAAVVSFIITSLILKFDKKGEDEEDLEGSIERSKSMKSEGKQVLGNVNHNDTDNISDKKINKISFVCDAGAGSSALGATTFRKRLKKADIADIEVKHYRIEDAPQDSDIIVVHKDLLDRARMAHNDKTIISIENYIDDPSLVKLVDELKND
ncbi:hypothetical protein [Oceanobacillus sp. AG]|uniref:hypothetical protein n=1 Tax=Oceanobacillus sp. AG TaxID=2681969 RepID=UPI00351A1B55